MHTPLSQHSKVLMVSFLPLLSLSSWSSAVMTPIPQEKRVSMGQNGDLYFSNVLAKDAQNDYSCNARFPFTHTIQQKNPFTLKVFPSE